MTKLLISGTAGQGIQFLGRILANILKDQGFKIALIYQYDAFVRGGESNMHLVFSKQQIDNPIIEKADLEYNLKDKKLQSNLLSRYNNPQIMNMTLLGVILKKLKIRLKDKEIEKYLPQRFKEINLQALKAGYK